MKFKVGDKVKIVKEADPRTTCWCSFMDKFIGKEGTVKKYDSNSLNENSYMIAIGNDESGYWYPEECLEFACIGTTPYIRATKQEDNSDKFISNYPHKCPKCQAPAYINFFDKVDCSREGCNGE